MPPSTAAVSPATKPAYDAVSGGFGWVAWRLLSSAVIVSGAGAIVPATAFVSTV